MHVKINYKLLAIKILFIIICILYITFLYFDMVSIQTFISTEMVKFISIILCSIVSILIGKDYVNKEDKLLLQYGLCITIVADYFLLFTNYFVLGVGIFSIVHILYAIRYERNKTRFTLIRSVIIFLIITGLYLIINFFVIKVELLFLVALFYAISLIISVAKSIKAYKYKLFLYPNKYLITLGMIFFLLCDVNVGIYNIIRLTNNPEKLTSLLYNTNVVFLPSFSSFTIFERI